MAAASSSTATAPAQTRHRASARERLLAAADELFYAEGVQTVGIDRIIERAGAAKGSLYNVFGSKEELVAAYLASRHDGTTGRLSKAIEQFHDPRQKILAVFDAQAELFKQPDFNGCAFIAASTEARPGGLIENAADRFRAWIRGMFTDLAEQAGAPDPVSLGRQFHLLYDGAGLAARMDHSDPRIAQTTRDAAQALLDAALARSHQPSPERRQNVRARSIHRRPDSANRATSMRDAETVREDIDV
jgi:AcrR family transcriptional regulator